MLDLMKLDVLAPDVLVDLKRAGLPDEIQRIDGGLGIGAGARMSQVADHELIVKNLPMARESLLLAAGPQIRNMASIGGNLLRRTRCPYFRHPEWRCNRREPGSGCDAIEGEKRMLAVLGTGEACIANYPGDLAVAPVACDATPHVEADLRPGEVIAGVDVPLTPASRWACSSTATPRCKSRVAGAATTSRFRRRRT